MDNYIKGILLDSFGGDIGEIEQICSELKYCSADIWNKTIEWFC